MEDGLAKALYNHNELSSNPLIHITPPSIDTGQNWIVSAAWLEHHIKYSLLVLGEYEQT